MYQELPINKEKTSAIQSKLAECVEEFKFQTTANDYEIYLVLKNLVSEHENYMNVRSHSAALAKALNNLGKA